MFHHGRGLLIKSDTVNSQTIITVTDFRHFYFRTHGIIERNQNYIPRQMCRSRHPRPAHLHEKKSLILLDLRIKIPDDMQFHNLACLGGQKTAEYSPVSQSA